MNDTIYRQTAIDGFYEMASDIDHLCTVSDYVSFLESLPSVQSENMSVNLDIQKITKHKSDFSDLDELPSAQSEISRIENALHGKSPEEQYDFIWWLMQDYGMQFTDTKTAVIEWLKGERDE